MNDDIQKLWAAIGFLDQELREDAIPALERVEHCIKHFKIETMFAAIDRAKAAEADRDSLRAEVEWLGKQLDAARACQSAFEQDAEKLEAERDSLRAKLDRAKDDLSKKIAVEETTLALEQADHGGDKTILAFIKGAIHGFKEARTVLFKLPDAPAQQFPKCRKESLDVREFIKLRVPAQQTNEVQLEPGWLLSDIRKAASRIEPAQQTQISELRAKLNKAKEALSAINEMMAGEPYRITVRAMKDIALDALTELSSEKRHEH